LIEQKILLGREDQVARGVKLLGGFDAGLGFQRLLAVVPLEQRHDFIQQLLRVLHGNHVAVDFQLERLAEEFRGALTKNGQDGRLVREGSVAILELC